MTTTTIKTKDELKKAWRYLRGDGCTSSPDFFYGECCRSHDADYRLGVDENGNPITRTQADKRLFACMKKTGKTPVVGKFVLPVVYWSFVRVFGRKIWNGYRETNSQEGQ